MAVYFGLNVTRKLAEIANREQALKNIGLDIGDLNKIRDITPEVSKSDLRTLSNSDYFRYLQELELVPERIEETLKVADKVKEIVTTFHESNNCLYLGRGFSFPVALEGALKLKEISYIHAEGYPAAEMKHGPIALVDENLPVVFVATKDMYYEKVVSNIQEIKARKGQVIAVATIGDNVLPTMSENIMYVPEIDEVIAPLLSVIPLQLLSYYVGVAKGIDVDKPRNLAKSVVIN